LPSTPSSAPSEPPPSRRARWLLAAIALVLVVVVGVITWVAVADNDGGAEGTVVPKVLSAKVGLPAPDFTLKTLDGKSVSLSDYRGTPVVLNFWASWCTPCRKEFPLLRDTVAARHGEFAIVGINTQDYIESDGRKFARDQHADWPNGFDESEGVRRGYGVTGLPETFFIDAKGVIRSHVILGLTKPVLDAQLAKITKPTSS
jgi:cytochrome c biogenesis protein CcmG/thiol:disulfide interchange protein DsbE